MMRTCKEFISIVIGALLAIVMVSSTVSADDTSTLFMSAPSRDVWHIDWASTSADHSQPALSLSMLASTAVDVFQDGGQPLHPAAIQHSDGYLTRAKIHKYASFATLPLFAGELILAQSLYNDPTDTKRTAHIVVGTGIISLFGVNTVTGAWNLFGEGRQDTEGRTMRLVHGLLMMAADAGFVATAASGPGGGRRLRDALAFNDNKARHRNIAVASISIGTAGYLLMLFGNH